MKYLINFRFLTELGLTQNGLRKSGVLAAGIIIAAMIPAASAQTGPAPKVPESGLINPKAVAFNPASGKVYSVDRDGGAVYVSDDAANSTVRVKVGTAPVSVAVDSVNGKAYVANAGDGTASVIDGKTNEVSATLQVGSHPYSIAANSTAGKIYVARTYSDQVIIIDAVSNAVSGVKTGSADLIAIDRKADKTYLL